MKILHCAPHYGGGIGTVVSALIKGDRNCHAAYSLEPSRDRRVNSGYVHPDMLRNYMVSADIVLVHYWDHPLIAEFLSHPLPSCRMVFWCHSNVSYSQKEKDFPDQWINTSPIQNGDYIWSTGDMDRFFKVTPKPHRGFNIGYVGTVDYKKLHPDFIPMCLEIKKRIPDARFLIAGNVNIHIDQSLDKETFKFLGEVEDIPGLLAYCDVFGYPLRPDHYGTCEQVLGEAMAAGVVPCVMANLAELEICGSGCKDPGEYVESIVLTYRAMKESPLMCKLASNNCRIVAREKYDVDWMVRQWNRVFHKMMENGKRERGTL